VSQQNNLHELWALLNFLLPEIFDAADAFDSWFQGDDDTDASGVLEQLHKVPCLFFLSLCSSVPGYGVRVRFLPFDYSFMPQPNVLQQMV